MSDYDDVTSGGGLAEASLAFPQNIDGKNKCGQMAVEDLGGVGLGEDPTSVLFPCPPSSDAQSSPSGSPLPFPSLPVYTVTHGLPQTDAPTPWGRLGGWGSGHGMPLGHGTLAAEDPGEPVDIFCAPGARLGPGECGGWGAQLDPGEQGARGQCL